MVENNPHKISTMGQGGSLAAITDASDFPHTGLIKGLSLMARQNIVVKNNSNDFDITQSTANSGTVAVSAGTYLRDGKLYTAQYKTGTTAASFTFGSSELITTYDKGYHLVVVDKNNFILIRKPTVANKVPDYTSGDTIIAIVEYSSTTSSGARNIQFLTTDKTENSVSIAYAAGTGDNLVYTEASAITGTSAGLFISGIGASSSLTDLDKIIIQDESASDVIKSVTVAQINALAPQGDITGVTAGDGLTGGGNSGAVTLAVGVDDSTIEINSDALRIKDGGITVGKMAANSVDSNQYVNSSIDAVHITDSAVTTNKIRDGNVTLAKLDDIADGRVLGNISGSAAAPSELTAANLRTLLTVADGSLSQNNFTDADHSKLNGIASSATAYADSDAISAVEGEADLALAGQVNFRADVGVVTSDPTPAIADSGTIYQFTKGSAGTFTLPASPTVGVQYVLVNGSGQDIVITRPNSNYKINGSTSSTVTNNTSYAATSIVCVVAGSSGEWLVFGGI
jgi:hypothetical protein